MTKSLRGLIEPEDVHLDVPANCKRSVLERLAGLAASRFGLDRDALLEKLIQRERLGSTGVGHGIAIPHARADVDELQGIVLRLRDKVDFEAIDNEPVDIVFLLLAPEADNASHLKALSRVARTFRMPGVVRALRSADDPEVAYAALLSESDQEAA
ncbi:PTS sugar transporter subunit IIA [Parvularcula lutaonensis]|uniref:PTS sugar transporter subunit IIA n=1 Tax=Parvularcula lutaonensis TaxID=491923 RepID=A0ABV7MAJ8_9PROT|nr:PTS sugar transporter subunit IIA [Parvularcula lutaonensis]GGY45308.1 PTS IIA-like nitrogen-regulatory protein PtsN [Parvularcula lutaonensis]